MPNTTDTEPTENFEAFSLNASDVEALGAAKLSAKSIAREDAQRNKRDSYFVKGPLTFKFIGQAIPDPASRVVLVAKAFADMANSKECVLGKKTWESAGVTSPDQRRRILVRLRNLPILRIMDRRGRPSVIFFD
jgi:hypothetical protein